jgi:hypothetical protein
MISASAGLEPLLAAERDYRILLTGSYLAGALLLGGVILAILSRWRRQEDRPLTPDAQLGHFRSLYESGLLSAEEFARLRGKLGERVPRSVPGPPGSPSQGAPSAPSGESITRPGDSEPPPPNPDSAIRPG